MERKHKAIAPQINVVETKVINSGVTPWDKIFCATAILTLPIAQIPKNKIHVRKNQKNN